jgi:hypothetical protein
MDTTKTTKVTKDGNTVGGSNVPARTVEVTRGQHPLGQPFRSSCASCSSW